MTLQQICYREDRCWQCKVFFFLVPSNSSFASCNTNGLKYIPEQHHCQLTIITASVSREQEKMNLTVFVMAAVTNKIHKRGPHKFYEGPFSSWFSLGNRPPPNAKQSSSATYLSNQRLSDRASAYTTRVEGEEFLVDHDDFTVTYESWSW